VHTYTYQADGRIATFDKGAGLNSFEYDDAGNRITWNEAGTIHRYRYDDADRVVEETDGSGAQVRHSWTYDDVGNVTEHVDEGVSSANSFLANNLIRETVRDGQTTTTTFDKTGRTLSQTVASDGQNFSYTFEYNADGTQASVTGQGEGASGSSFSTYDENQRLVRLDLGQGDNRDSLEFRTFAYNNDGQILTRFHDDGKNGTANPTTEFLYADGNPVAEVDDQGRMEVDEGRYDPIKIMSEEFPAAAVIDYVVRSGDTLQSIAAQIYGNPSLWFVIADANGLSGSEALREGMHLKIPNTVQNGRLTADTHALYNEGDIVGSKLPNLNSPPPPQTAQQSSGGDNCAVIGAIILTVLVAIVAIALTIVTAGIAAPAAAAAIGLTSTAAVAAFTIGATAVAGAVIGFAASAATQGIQIGFGLQQEFDWKQVAIDTVAGFVGGAFGALGQVATTAVKGAQLGVALTRIARVAIIAGEAAAEVGVEAASQAAANEGRIEQPWMLGVAVGGVVAGELLSKGIKLIGRRLGGAADDVAQAAAAAAPGKKVTFQASDGSIVTKSVGQVAAKPKDVTTPIKAVDTQLVATSPNGTLSLKIKDPGEIFNANSKKPGWKPTTWTDVAASVLTTVQTPSKLNQAATSSALLAMKQLNAGQTGKFDASTVTDFTAGTTGKVKNNKVPVDQLPGADGVAAKKQLTGDDVVKAWQAKGKISKPAVTTGLDLNAGVKVVKLDAQDLAATKFPKTTVLGPQPLGTANPPTATGLGTAVPTTPLAPATGLPVNKIALGVQDLGAAKLPKPTGGTGNPPSLTAKEIQALGDAHTDPDEKLRILLKVPLADAGLVKSPDLPDYNNINPADLPMLRQKFRAELDNVTNKPAVDRFQYLEEGVKKSLKKADKNGIDVSGFDQLLPEEKVAIRGYTDDVAFGSGKGRSDYAELNKALFMYDKPAQTKLEGYLSTLSSAISKLPNEPTGPVYRGANNLPDAVLNRFRQPGATMIEPTFFSSTKDFGTAFQGDALIVTNLRTGRYVSPISAAGLTEQEILSIPGKKFKVLRFEDYGAPTKIDGGTKDRRYVIYLDEVI
jgi:YD repeat-containing protein